MVVTINVPDYTALYEHIKRPHLDEIILDEELQESAAPFLVVSIRTQSDGKSYALKAYALYNGQTVIEALAIVRKGIEAKFGITDGYYNSFVVNTPLVGNSEVEKIAGAMGLYGVEVTDSGDCIWALGGAGLAPMTRSRLITGEKPFADDFNFFKTVMQTAMTAIYDMYGHEGVPDLTLTVRASQK